jgi:hypothetical protein
LSRDGLPIEMKWGIWWEYDGNMMIDAMDGKCYALLIFRQTHKRNLERRKFDPCSGASHTSLPKKGWWSCQDCMLWDVKRA